MADRSVAEGAAWVEARGAERDHASLPYMPALDGVRAVAVLGVLLAHFEAPFAHGGVVGVDVFFVLSGFLITRIIQPQIAAGQFTTEFYWRRFNRLFPPLAVLCVVYGAVGLALLSPGKVAADVAASLLYASNWTQAFGDSVPTYLGHTWSLAVEEQFYLLWPALLMAGLRFGARRVALALVVLIAAIVAWRDVLASGDTFERVYFGFDTRCDALFVGCLLALLPKQGRLARLAARTLSLAGVAVLALFARVHWSAGVALPVDLAAGWLVLGASQRGRTLGHRVLTQPGVVYIGAISYSLYLWHFVIYQGLHLGQIGPPWMVALVGIPASVTCAVASYHFVERPCRRLRDRPVRRVRVALGIGCVAVPAAMMACGVAWFQRADVVDWLYPRPFAVLDYGPQSVARGGAFNRQPDGASALWIHTSTRPPAHVRGYVDGGAVTVLPGPAGFVVIIPAAILATPGRRSIELDRAEGEALCPPFTLTVTGD